MRNTAAHSRRLFLRAALTLLATGCSSGAAAPVAQPLPPAPRAPPAPPAPPSPLAIEARVGGRLGVFALDSGSGRQLAYRADERFAMASTFKWALAAHILYRVDRGELSLDERVAYGPDDVLAYAPVAKQHLDDGALTINALAEAAVTVSDNTAANLLLAKVGGPAGLTAFLRAQGDAVTRLDRNEPTLNTNLAGDPRDTTTPQAMVGLLKRALLGDVLAATSRQRLLSWLADNKTGGERLRAGFPSSWKVGDKTGTGNRNAVNDVAIATPPGRAPILVAVFTSGSDAPMKRMNQLHVDVAQLIVERFS